MLHINERAAVCVVVKFEVLSFFPTGKFFHVQTYSLAAFNRNVSDPFLLSSQNDAPLLDETQIFASLI
jgi:hypothetical protein